MAHPYDVQGARAGTIVRRALIALGVALGLCLLLLATLPKEASAQDGSSPAASHVSPSATLELDFGDSQTFTASATDADGNLSELTWYVDGEQTSGEQLAQLGSAEGAYTHRFTNCGDYSVEARFTDSDGLSNSVLWDLSVCPAEPTNKPPIATKDYPTNEPFRPEFGEKVRYGASARDPDGSIRKYEWLVDGKTVATDDRENVSGTFAISIPFTFDEQATYLVEIIFTDNNGTSSSISWTVIPDSGLPPALGDIGCSPSEVKVGQTVNCVPQLLAGAPEIIRWDAEEDGNTVKSGHDRDFSVSFDSPGEKTIAIFLSNHRGSLRVGTSITVIADGSSTPRIDDIGCSPPDPEVDDTVTCTPSLGGGAVSTYAWSAPGGDPPSGSDATFTTSWNATGDKQVSLEVCNDGECDTGEQSIAVSEAEVTSPTTTTQPTNGTTGGTPTVTTTTTQPPGGTTGGTPTTTESMPPEVSALSLLTPEELDGLEAGSAYGFAAKAIDENADIVSLRWFVYDEFLTYYNLVQFDPSSLVESALVYRIPKDGDYLIRVDFVDSKSWEGTTKWSFTAKDYAPNVDALSCTPDSPEVGDIVRCSPTLSGGTPREEFWLAFDSVRRSRSGQDYLMTWNTPGDKQVTLLVCNWSLQCGYHTQAIQVLPKSSPPIIDSVGCDQDVIHVGENLRCTPQISGGPPVEYSWTAQYGFPPTGNRESFAPDWHTRGQSTVTLKVCNRIEECDSSSQTVTVGHPIPTPVIESIGCRPLTVDIDDEVECEARLAENGQDVFYDRSEDDVLFSWSLSSDDEATYEWLDQDLSVRWYESGRERIKLKVCNIEDECDTERQTITVRRDRGSSLQINSLGCPEGKVDVDQNATCNPDVSADGRVDYYWTAYSGSPRNGRSRSFQTRWSVPGTKTINLRVCDGNECLDAERNMEVVEPATVNRPPVVTRISPGSPITVVVGGNYTFVAHATDPDGDLRSVGWQVSQRSTPATPPLASSASPTQTYDHVFDSPGHFLVSVAFYDSAGQSGRVVWEVTAVYNAIYIGAQDIHRGNLNATGDEQLLRLFVSGNRLLRLELAGPQSADLDFTVGFEGIEEDISRYWESNSSDRLQSIEIRTTSAGWYTIRISLQIRVRQF